MFIQLDPNFFLLPKVRAAGCEGRELYLCGLTICHREYTGMFLSLDAANLCAGYAGVDVSAIATLVDVGLWEPVEGGYKVRDYHGQYKSAKLLRLEGEARHQNNKRNEPITSRNAQVTPGNADDTV